MSALAATPQKCVWIKLKLKTKHLAVKSWYFSPGLISVPMNSWNNLQVSTYSSRFSCSSRNSSILLVETGEGTDINHK